MRVQQCPAKSNYMLLQTGTRALTFRSLKRFCEAMNVRSDLPNTSNFRQPDIYF